MQDRIRESGTRMSTPELKPSREAIGRPRAGSVRHAYVAGDHSRVLGWEPTESLEPRLCVDVTVCGGGGDLDMCWDGTVWGRDTCGGGWGGISQERRLSSILMCPEKELKII
ncbi:unnamed protein product [Boreogadus saida]